LKNAILIALICALLFSAGCAGGGSGASASAAISLAKKTLEGELTEKLMSALEKTDNCHLGECKTVFSLLERFLSEEDTSSFQLNDEELKTLIEMSKDCEPKIERNVEQVTTEVYMIGYEFKVSEACELQSFKDATGNVFLAIQVDFGNREAEVVHGALDPEQAAQAEAFKPGLMIVGNCFAPIAGAIGMQYFTPSAGSGPGYQPVETPVFTPTPAETQEPTPAPTATVAPTAAPTQSPTATPSPLPTVTPQETDQPGGFQTPSPTAVDLDCGVVKNGECHPEIISWKCMDGGLVIDCVQCGCPEGYTCNEETLICHQE